MQFHLFFALFCFCFCLVLFFLFVSLVLGVRCCCCCYCCCCCCCYCCSSSSSSSSSWGVDFFIKLVSTICYICLEICKNPHYQHCKKWKSFQLENFSPKRNYRNDIKSRIQISIHFLSKYLIYYPKKIIISSHNKSYFLRSSQTDNNPPGYPLGTPCSNCNMFDLKKTKPWKKTQPNL